jgi:hypothetical protein
VQALHPYATSTDRYNPYNTYGAYGIEPLTTAAIIGLVGTAIGTGGGLWKGRKDRQALAKQTKRQHKEARRQEAFVRESQRLAEIEARRQKRHEARKSQMELLALQVQAQQAGAERATAGPRQTRILVGVAMGVVGLIIVANVFRRRARR